MSEREEHERLADELERLTDRMEQESEHLQDKIGSVREDWERKRGDDAVAGAPPPPGSDE